MQITRLSVREMKCFDSDGLVCFRTLSSRVCLWRCGLSRRPRGPTV